MVSTTFIALLVIAIFFAVRLGLSSHARRKLEDQNVALRETNRTLEERNESLDRQNQLMERQYNLFAIKPVMTLLKSGARR